MDASEFNRKNFYVKLLIDDKPVKIPAGNCDPLYRCSWDSVGQFIEDRLYTRDEIDSICFSHLNYAQTQGNMPWWLAFIIALPMVLATVLAIRCFLKWKKTGPSP